MPLEATPQGLVAQVPKPTPSFPSTTLSSSPVILITPCRWQARLSCLSAGSASTSQARSDKHTPMTSGMVQRGTRLAIKDKPRERCAAAGADGKP